MAKCQNSFRMVLIKADKYNWFDTSIIAISTVYYQVPIIELDAVHRFLHLILRITLLFSIYI